MPESVTRKLTDSIYPLPLTQLQPSPLQRSPQARLSTVAAGSIPAPAA